MRLQETCVAALVIVALVAWGLYFRDSVNISDHIPASCALMLTANDMWPSVRELPQWSYAVKSYGDDVPWLASADAVSNMKETFLMSLVGQEVRVVMWRDEGPGVSTVYLVKLSRLGKFSDVIARLLRRVRVESHEGVKIRRVERGQPFYYTVLGRVLIGGLSRDDVVDAARLPEDRKLVEPPSLGRMERGAKTPWVALYCDMEGSGVGAEASPFESLCGVLRIEQDGIQAQFDAPWRSEFRDSAAQLVEKMQPRTLRAGMRMPANVIAGLTLCGSAPFGEILDSAARAFEIPQLRPGNWGTLVTGRGATVAAACGALLAEFVDALSNEATIALTNIDIYEIVPTPEFIFFGEARQGVQEKLLHRLEQTVERVGGGQYRLQRKSVKGVETAYLDLPEGRSLQLCVAGIGDMVTATTSEYALETLIDTVVGDAPSIKVAEPDLIEPERGANLVLVLNVQRLIETSQDLLELLFEYDLLADMDREKYDRQIVPALGLGRFFRSVGVSAFLGSDSIRGEVKVPFAGM